MRLGFTGALRPCPGHPCRLEVWERGRRMRSIERQLVTSRLTLVVALCAALSLVVGLACSTQAKPAGEAYRASESIATIVNEMGER